MDEKEAISVAIPEEEKGSVSSLLDSSIETEPNGLDNFVNKVFDGIGTGINAIKDKIASMEGHAPFTIAGNNRAVNVFENADLFTKVVNGCPEPIVIHMSETEIKAEMERVQAIADKIAKANGLEDITIDRAKGLSNLAAGIGDKGIQANPLFTKGLSDDGLAFAIGHEMAHNMCSHWVESYKIGLVEEKINSATGLYDDLTITNALEKAHEVEADRYGALFAKKAGFSAEKGIENFLNEDKFYNYDDKMYLSVFPYTVAEHPTAEVRIALVKEALQDENLSFTLEDSKKRAENAYFISDRFNRGGIEKGLAIEREIATRVLPIIEKEKMLFLKNLEKVPQMPKEEQIKMSYYLKEFLEQEKKFGVNRDILKTHDKAKALGKEDILEHRVKILAQSAEKEDSFKAIAEKVLSSITDRERKELYKESMRNISNSRIRGERARSAALAVNRIAAKGMAAPINVPRSILATTLRAVEESRRRTREGRYIPEVYKTLHKNPLEMYYKDRPLERFSMPRNRPKMSLAAKRQPDRPLSRER